MKIFGIDFTSVPSDKKPITCACCRLHDDRLVVEGLSRLTSLNEFSEFLESPGPWIAGIDFPFGQPRRLLDNLDWPRAWPEYVAYVARLSRPQFRQVLEDYKRGRPQGDREHRRAVDHLTGAQSPQKLYGVPVALMFFEGAQRLLRSSVNVVPVRVTESNQVVVEAYPALVARVLVGKERYKPTEKGEAQEEAQRVRERMTRKLGNATCRSKYGITVDLSDSVRMACVDDVTGDSIDAVCAAVQAAWALQRQTDGYGVPQDCDLAEGWIVDPVTRPSVNSSITRVRPVFRALFQRDGSSWLRQILGLVARDEIAGRMATAPGNLLKEVTETRPFADPTGGRTELERCFEYSVPPSETFLRWLIEHPERLDWSGPLAQRAAHRVRPTTRARREALRGLTGRQSQLEAQDDARRLLRRKGAEKSGRQWWAFEGFTEVDCCLETDRLVLLIEGKRTESLADSTAWCRGRNQVHRNLEAARALARGREYAVIVIGEERIADRDLGDPSVGLPHLTTSERRDLMAHFLGCLTWRQVCDKTGLDYGSLPRNVARRTATAPTA